MGRQIEVSLRRLRTLALGLDDQVAQPRNTPCASLAPLRTSGEFARKPRSAHPELRKPANVGSVVSDHPPALERQNSPEKRPPAGSTLAQFPPQGSPAAPRSQPQSRQDATGLPMPPHPTHAPPMAHTHPTPRRLSEKPRQFPLRLASFRKMPSPRRAPRDAMRHSPPAPIAVARRKFLCTQGLRTIRHKIKIAKLSYYVASVARHWQLTTNN
jgi:hypothetical protein